MEKSRGKNALLSMALGLISTIVSLGAGFGYLWTIGEPHLARYLDEREEKKIKGQKSFRVILVPEIADPSVKADRVHIKLGNTINKVDEMKLYLPQLKALFNKNISFAYKDSGVEYWFTDGRDYEIQRDENGFSYYIKNGRKKRLP